MTKMTVMGRTMRLPGNRRVFVGKLPDGWYVEFKRLGDPAFGEKLVHKTPLRLSDDAMIALVSLVTMLSANALESASTYSVFVPRPMGASAEGE